MKKLITIILTVLILMTLVGCGNSTETPQAETDVTFSGEKPLDILCSSYLIYDWSKNIFDPDDYSISIDLLADPETDIHNFIPSEEDLLRIGDCDLFICFGGQADRWVNAINMEETRILKLIETAGTPEDDTDPWVSITNVEGFINVIIQRVSEITEAEYKYSADEYLQKLQALDGVFQDELTPYVDKTILLADKNPFSYMFAEYGLSCCSAFSRCLETGSEADTVALANMFSDSDMQHVLALKDSDFVIAKNVIERSTKPLATALTIDAMHVTSFSKDYLEMMNDNLNVLLRYFDSEYKQNFDEEYLETFDDLAAARS